MAKRLSLLIFLAVLAVPAALRASAVDGRMRGWIAAPGPQEAPLPDGVQVLDESEDERFVEVSAAARGALNARGLAFRPAPGAFFLTVGGERIDVRAGEPDLPGRWKAVRATDALRPFLVKFRSPVRPGWFDGMRGLGAVPVQYLPSFGYLVLLQGDAGRALGRLDAVEFTGEYHPAYKADAGLRALAERDERIDLRLVLFDLPGREQVVEAARLAGGRVVHRSSAAATSQRSTLHYVLFESFPTAALPRVLAAPEVYWAERWAPPQPEGERAAQIVAGNVAAGVPLPDYYAWLAAVGADGTGVTVAVADTGFDTGNPATVHPDLQGRVSFAAAICSDSRDFNGHGTNVASLATGDPRATSGGTGLLDSSAFHWGGGSAPGASLYVQSALGGACPAVNSDAATLAEDAVGTGGAHIGNHSFTDGLGGGASYNSQAQAWDAVVRDAVPSAPGNQPYAVIFSSGNSGPGSSSLTSPKGAKNIITVGATENYRPGECPGISGCGGSADDIDRIVDFSSRGPTTDGRLKPDLAAPGHVAAGAFSSAANYGCTCDGGAGNGCCDSTGVDGTFSYSRFSGTSQAAPRVAGASAVVHDWFQNRSGALPSPAMNKAILVNGAVDMKSADVPNNVEGWGRVSLRDVLQTSVGVEFLDQSVILGSTGAAAAFTTDFYVQNPSVPMKATLVWTDPPGAINCNPCLVNDLDLKISQSTVWRGNNFSGGLTTPGGAADILNNVEGIRLAPGDLACAAMFQVEVRAQTLAGDGVPGDADATDQDFALVVRNAGTSPGPPRMAVSDSTVGAGCDGDAFLDRAETVDLDLNLGNIGCSLATGLTAELSVQSAPAGASIVVSPAGPQSLPDLAAGAATPFTWQVSLGDGPDSFCGDVLTLRVDFAGGQGGAWQDAVELILDGESLLPATDLDPANTDNSTSRDLDWSLQSCATSSAPTSWHMGHTDCSGIVGDAAAHSVVFTYQLTAGDRLRTLGFQHAFDANNNTTSRDAAIVEIDHDNDGDYDVLQTWLDGIDNPPPMTAAGPYDLTGFNATRADTVAVRFRFQSAANWVGPNRAPGWDVDDIELAFDALQCDPNTCLACPPAPDPVPDGSDGPPLLVEPDGAGVRLTWGAVIGATRYNVYQGTLGSYYTHDRFADPNFTGGDSCHEPGTSVAIDLPTGSVYFFVASDNGCAESVYGFDWMGTSVPFAPSACSPN